MKADSEALAWREQLQAALVKIEACPESAGWLKEAIRQAVTVADDLAPCSDPPPGHDAFLYPH